MHRRFPRSRLSGRTPDSPRAAWWISLLDVHRPQGAPPGLYRPWWSKPSALRKDNRSEILAMATRSAAVDVT